MAMTSRKVEGRGARAGSAFAPSARVAVLVVASLVAVHVGVGASMSVALAQAPEAESVSLSRIDEADPCSAAGLPAVSPSGRRIAYVSCWTDLSDALDARFVLIDTADGHTLSEIVLMRRRGDGRGGETPEASVRRRVARANRALSSGRFVPMVPIEGLGDGGMEGRASGLIVRLDAERRLLVASDAAGGGGARARARARGRASLPDYPRNPFCCGGDPDDTTACGVPPEVRHAWTDAAGRFVLAEIVGGSMAPDGCEGGPDFVFFSTLVPTPTPAP